ncbi:MAG: phosphatase PAP2 family protein [Bdellovibrio sp.]|nr:phosphatase PAP2 family protein [Bdellovibrio sp.]
MPRNFSSFRYFLISLLVSLHCFAEAAASKDTSLLIDGWDNFKSPVTTDAKYFLLGGTALTALFYLTRDQTQSWQEDMANNKPLGSSSNFGDLMGKQVPNLLYAGGMAAAELFGDYKMGYRNASGMVSATVYSYLVTSALKYTIQEERPNHSSNHDSFPSAHTASAFAFASYVGCRHSLSWGIAAYSLATFVGMSRINDNAHYIHDVVAGATIGGSFGLGTCLAENKRSTEREHPKDEVKPSWYVVPQDGGFLGGFNVSY